MITNEEHKRAIVNTVYNSLLFYDGMSPSLNSGGFSKKYFNAKGNKLLFYATKQW